jgi:hypothetical protein
VNEAPHSDPRHYRSIVGKLKYLEKCTRPEIAYAVHQCARFSKNPKISHSKAIKHMGRYLLASRGQGMICTPKHESLVYYCDADFSGNWKAYIAEDDRSTIQVRPDHVPGKSYSTPVVQLFGHHAFKHKSLSVLKRVNIFNSLRNFEKSFL